ncbi:MAG: DNRLRE domain-containing protein, partial [Chloroflexi bacterium]|nr:DNRLRE domain-containing protein [Chloroflexota bacterium]
RAAAPWSEGAIVWAVAAEPGERYGSAQVRHGDWGWYRFDVTRWVVAWHQGALEDHGLIIVGPEGVPNRRGFSSREGPHPPELVVEYEGAPPPPTATATPTPTERPSATASLTLSATPTRTSTPTPPRRRLHLPLVQSR